MRYYQSVYRLIVRRLTVLFCDGMETRYVNNDQEMTMNINTVAERIFTCDWLPIGSSRSDPCSLSLEAADICNHKEDL